MRDLRQFDHLRDVQFELDVYGQIGDSTAGVFWIDFRLVVIASSADDWDHISVSRPDRCPTWEEMERVKRMFFEDNETAMQLHVPPAEHIPAGVEGRLHNSGSKRAQYCLHLWRPKNERIPRPPSWMVDVQA